MPETLLMPDFLDGAWRQRILAAMAEAPGAAAAVYGGSRAGAVDPRVRSAQLLDVPDEIRRHVASRLAAAQEDLAARFGVTLSGFEESKFLRYVPGDHFVAHQDGNTPSLFDDTRHRRVSIVIFVNDDYEGGSLVLHGAYPKFMDRHPVPAAPGSLVAFRSETTHEVTPVTSGERYTIVSWFRE